MYKVYIKDTLIHIWNYKLRLGMSPILKLSHYVCANIPNAKKETQKQKQNNKIPKHFWS